MKGGERAERLILGREGTGEERLIGDGMGEGR